MRLLFNQTGASIVQGLLIAGAVAGMGFVGTRMMQDQKLAQKGISSRNNVEQLHDMVYSILQNKDNCTATMLADNLNTDAVWNNPGNEAMTAIATRNPIDTANPSKIFQVNNSATYQADLSYMNNSVTIDSITLVKPAGLDFTNPANLEIVYRKLDSSGNKRLGKGYGGTTVKKTLPLKIQRNLTNSAFESCYGVQTGDTDQVSKDFCERLGVDDGDPNTAMFEWDADHQQCKFKDLKCPVGQVFAGIDSTGRRLCHTIQSWMPFSNFIDPAGVACNPATADAVSFVVVGDKVTVQCTNNSCTPSPACPAAWGPNIILNSSSLNQPGWPWDATLTDYRMSTYAGGVSGVNCEVNVRKNTTCTGAGVRSRCIYINTNNQGCAAGPAPESCSTACDCPNPKDTCEYGKCVDRSDMNNFCPAGTLTRGDASGQYMCNGSNGFNTGILPACGTGTAYCSTQDEAQQKANDDGATGCALAALDDCTNTADASGGTKACYTFDSTGSGKPCDKGILCNAGASTCYEAPHEASQDCNNSGGFEEGHMSVAECQARMNEDPSNYRCIKFNRTAGCSKASLCKGGTGGSCLEHPHEATQQCLDTGGLEEGHFEVSVCLAKANAEPGQVRCIKFQKSAGCNMGSVCRGGSDGSCFTTKDLANQNCIEGGGTFVDASPIATCEAAKKPGETCLKFNEGGTCNFGLRCKSGAAAMPACCPRTGNMVDDCASQCADDGSGNNFCADPTQLQCY